VDEGEVVVVVALFAFSRSSSTSTRTSSKSNLGDESDLGSVDGPLPDAAATANVDKPVSYLFNIELRRVLPKIDCNKGALNEELLATDAGVSFVVVDVDGFIMDVVIREDTLAVEFIVFVFTVDEVDEVFMVEDKSLLDADMSKVLDKFEFDVEFVTVVPIELGTLSSLCTRRIIASIFFN
jgi:hypothetical protein